MPCVPDTAFRTTEQRETFTQSVARIDMLTFRQQPDLRYASGSFADEATV